MGILPALNFLLKPSENGPIDLGMGRLIIWSIGICFFGVFVAVPLRKEVLIREKLRFPSGTATALMIDVLHGNEKNQNTKEPIVAGKNAHVSEVSSRGTPNQLGTNNSESDETRLEVVTGNVDHRSDWRSKIRLLIIAFAISSIYVRHLKPKTHELTAIDFGHLFYPPTS